MKIAYVIHGLGIGGAETVVTNYLIELKKQGNDVFLIELFKTDTFLRQQIIENGIKIYTLLETPIPFYKKFSRKLFLGYICTRNMQKVLGIEQPDIIHFHTSVKNFKKLKFDFNKVFFSFHTDVKRDIAIQGKEHIQTLMRWKRKGLNIFVLHNMMQKDAASLFGKNSVFVLPNGIDIKNIGTKRYDRVEFLKQLNIPQDAFIVGHVGRFHPIKNHEKVIEIFQEVKKRRENAHLLLVGEKSGEQYEKIKNFVSEKDLTSNVHFLGTRKDATAVISTFDALVLPSHKEGFSLVAIESQVHGVRTILSDAVPSDVMCNDNCFALNAEEDSSVWAEYILGQNKNDQLQRNDIKNFEIERVIKELVNYYQTAIERKNE